MHLFLILLLFFAFMIIGTPLALILLIVTFVGFYINGIPFTSVVQMVIDGMRSPTMLAIPYYILVGEIMNKAGVTEKIFNFCLAFVGHFKGGMGNVNVIASMIFAGISGSATADAAGLGRIEMEAMVNEGYDVDFSAAITAASSTIGPIIPPSIHLVIYAGVAEVPLSELFIAGIVPGVLMGLFLMLAVYILAKTGRVTCPTRPKASLKNMFTSFITAIPALLLVVIIIGGITLGIVTATEAGLIAIIYGLLLGLVYKKLNFKVLGLCLRNTIYSTCVVLFMLAVSKSFSYFITIERVPSLIMDTIFTLTESQIIILIIINFLLLGLGMMGTAASNIVIVTPILLPIARSFGLSPIHYGIVIVLGLMIGLITPPVGTSLYVLSDVANISFERVAKATLIFTIPLIILLHLITFVPELSLFLVNLVN